MMWGSLCMDVQWWTDEDGTGCDCERLVEERAMGQRKLSRVVCKGQPLLALPSLIALEAVI
jgi:hypothetical protein